MTVLKQKVLTVKIPLVTVEFPKQSEPLIKVTVNKEETNTSTKGSKDAGCRRPKSGSTNKTSRFNQRSMVIALGFAFGILSACLTLRLIWCNYQCYSLNKCDTPCGHYESICVDSISGEIQSPDKFLETCSKMHLKPSLPAQCTNIRDEDRFYCISKGPMNKYNCCAMGCCWSEPKQILSRAPHCFYPSQYSSYKFVNLSASDTGAVLYLEIISNSTYPRNVAIVRIDFKYRTEDIIEVKLYDPLNSRFETPFPELPPMNYSFSKKPKYFVSVSQGKTGFQIVRRSNNKTIFDTQSVGGLIFSDQLLQLSAKLPTSRLYGLGQQRNDFQLNMNWQRITLFNHDQPPKDGTNLYGSHPFYLAVEDDGLSSGVLLLNSNAMDIILQPTPAITYRTIGGVLDFFMFLGPSPADVLRQYTELVGRPFMPPFWSLGFHLCRFGYKTLNNTMDVMDRTRAAGIPLDTQWNDLDYMQDGNVFTYDKDRFKGLPQFVDSLHKEGMHYMVLVDPGLSAGEMPGTYPPYDEGIAQQVFVTDYSGYTPFIGKVWNKKSTVFVDFFKPAAVPYWMDQLRQQHNVFAFDGAWIDMNDPSNFLNGTTTGCPNTTLDYPPYLPGIAGGLMFYRTLCMSATHHNSMKHYDVHNAYGLAEALVTSFAMQQIRNKRAFVISRSSFPGHGRYAGVWTGDINSSWDDMAHSVSDVLSFSLFGIPMSGADICGFNGNATSDLCVRWSQLGAFYPFSRNHNSDQSSDQDPVALGSDVVMAARKSLLVRYSLLPYLYTLFFHAHSRGDTVARPMFVEFPHDKQTYTINSQFLWGPALLIAPVLEEGGLNVKAYLPAGLWYDFYSYKMIKSDGSEHDLPAPMDTIPLLLRAGFIIPSQPANVTTTLSRRNPVTLLASLDENWVASGDLYWDDGDSLDHNEGVYNLVIFEVAGRKFRSEVQQWNYNKETLMLDEIKLIGVDSYVHEVKVAGKVVFFEYHDDIKMLHVKHLHLELSIGFELVWE